MEHCNMLYLEDTVHKMALGHKGRSVNQVISELSKQMINNPIEIYHFMSSSMNAIVT
uniref:Uncharacterized protein n=1 Tax=Rhizophora mucronata TaxID=61149 RepID=A0A2P2LD77_RHIMU